MSNVVYVLKQTIGPILLVVSVFTLFILETFLLVTFTFCLFLSLLYSILFIYPCSKIFDLLPYSPPPLNLPFFLSRWLKFQYLHTTDFTRIWMNSGHMEFEKSSVYLICMAVIIINDKINKTGISTTVWLHYMGSNKTLGGKSLIGTTQTCCVLFWIISIVIWISNDLVSSPHIRVCQPLRMNRMWHKASFLSRIWI